MTTAPGRVVVGLEGAAVWRAMWFEVATRRSLLHDGTWPPLSRDTGWPVGGRAVSAAPLHDLLAVPLLDLLGPVATTNLLALASVLLGAAGGGALARECGQGRTGAWVAATVVGFNALLLTAGLASGVPALGAMALIPWLLVGLFRLLRAPGPWPAAGVALVLGLLALADLHQAFFLPVLLPVLLLPAARDAWRTQGPGRRAWWWTALAVGLLLAALAGLPVLRALAEPSAIVDPAQLRPFGRLDPEEMARAGHDLGSLDGLLTPGAGRLLVRDRLDAGIQSVYAGWLALALATLGICRGRLRWLAVGLVAAVLSFGPYLFLTLDSWRDVPLPGWMALRRLLPAVDMLHAYVRALGWFYVALGVLAGAGAERLVALLPRGRLAVALPLVLSALVFAETMLLSPVPFPLPTAPAEPGSAAAWLARVRAPGAVIDWPRRARGGRLVLGRPLFDQAHHGRPIPWTAAGNAGQSGVDVNPFIVQLARESDLEPAAAAAQTAISRLPADLGARELGDMGFRWLVLHPAWLPVQRRALVETWLGSLLAVEARLDDGAVVYALPASSVP